MCITRHLNTKSYCSKWKVGNKLCCLSAPSNIVSINLTNRLFQFGLLLVNVCVISMFCISFAEGEKHLWNTRSSGGENQRYPGFLSEHPATAKTIYWHISIGLHWFLYYMCGGILFRIFSTDIAKTNNIFNAIAHISLLVSIQLHSSRN